MSNKKSQVKGRLIVVSTAEKVRKIFIEMAAQGLRPPSGGSGKGDATNKSPKDHF